MHEPTPIEHQLMSEWIRDYRAFVHNEEDYNYGTSRPGELKVMTNDGRIEIRQDARWHELLKVIDLFSGQ